MQTRDEEESGGLEYSERHNDGEKPAKGSEETCDQSFPVTQGGQVSGNAADFPRPEVPQPESPRRSVRRRRPPLLTISLVMANAAVFVAERLSAAGNWASIYGQDQIAVWDGEYWRLLTAPFLHAFFAHLFFNCLGVYLFGEVIERLLGRWVLLLVYVTSGLVGGFAFQAFSSDLGIGASGAVYGLAGMFLLIRFGRAGDGGLRLSLRYVFFLVFFLGLDWASARVAAENWKLQIATSAHLGGVISGSVVGYAVLVRRFGAPGFVRRAVAWCAALGGVTFGAYALFFPIWNSTWVEWRSVDRAIEEGTFDVEQLHDLARVTDSYVVAERLIHRFIFDGARDVELAEEDPARYDELTQRAIGRFTMAVESWEAIRNVALGRAPVGAPKSGASGYSVSFLGYFLFDELMGSYLDQLGTQVLDSLIELEGSRVKFVQSSKEVGREEVVFINNSFAWLLGLKGDRLDEALRLAQEAVDQLRENRPTGFQQLADGEGHRRLMSACVNTLGWILFLLNEDPEMGIRRLIEATRIYELGANFLYLAYAHAGLGDLQAAEQALQRAEELGQLSRYERRLVAELRDELGL